MGIGKQAKILSKGQVDAVLSYLTTTRHPERDRVTFLLSLKAGLRAKEIASLQWSMVTDADSLGDLLRAEVSSAEHLSQGLVV